MAENADFTPVISGISLIPSSKSSAWISPANCLVHMDTPPFLDQFNWVFPTRNLT
jgi:hypothetical protein